jgi:NADH-quinone oxidoreductase subunit N
MFPSNAQLDALTWSLGSSALQLAPELVLCTGIVVLLVLRMLSGGSRLATMTTGTAFVFVALLVAVYQLMADASAGSIFQGMLVADSFALVLRPFLLAGTGLILVLIQASRLSDPWDQADLQVLLLGSTVGLLLMVQVQHLLMLLIAIEMAGVPTYALAAFPKGRRTGSEAALKFVVFGAAASGVMLYGMTLLAGVFGTGYLPNLVDGIARRGLDLPVLAGLALLGIGLGFKLSVAPLHLWCPDVFEGATAEIAGYLATVSKTATGALLLRLLHSLHTVTNDPWQLTDTVGLSLGVVAALSMTVGNLGAFAQKNLQRLLAYSTIAHAGYILLGVAVVTTSALQAVVFYLIVYLLMNLGAFAAIAWVRQTTGRVDLEAVRGLVSRHPLPAVTFTLFLVSLLGLPPLAGFAAKFQVFLAVYQAGQAATEVRPVFQLAWYTLLGIALVNTVISAYYYLRVVRAMILDPPTDPEIPAPQNHSTASTQLLLVLLGLAILILGIYWQPLTALCHIAANAFS